MPVASSFVSGIKGKGVGATPAACGVTGTQRATASAGNTNGPGLGAINQELPSGKSFCRMTLPKLLADTLAASLLGLRDGASSLSVPRGVTLPGETVLPLQEMTLGDAEPSYLTPRIGDPSNAIGTHWLPLRCASLLDGCGQATATTVLTHAYPRFRLPRTTHGRGLYPQKNLCVITGEA